MWCRISREVVLRREEEAGGKMVVTKVLICGGLVVVVAYGIFVCSYKLCRLRFTTQGVDEDAAGAEGNAVVGGERQGSKDLLAPLLDNDATVGQTWRGSRRSVSVTGDRGVEKDLESAVTLESESRSGRKSSVRKELVEGLNSRVAPPNVITNNCKLQLEVTAGPGTGLRAEKMLGGSNAVLTVGRLPQNDLVLTDPEVSGKHIVISWNNKVAKWELVDLGSLNGTLVNGEPAGTAHVANSPVRQRGPAIALTNGDIVTLGSSSTMLVRIMVAHLSIASAPFEVGVASDPMSHRRGGRALPMEDVCLCEWPLRGLHEVPFGVFCVFDGHGGSAAAESASRIMPQKIAELLTVRETLSRVLINNEASDVLRSAFQNTEEALDHLYEGCTATVLLLWSDSTGGFSAQCANVGDSHCIVSNGDDQLIMTQDHRLTSKDERLRLLECGKILKDGENRLAGMNIARALGDKFLKGEEAAFSSEPYVSRVFRLDADGRGLVVIASDGLWDVLSPRRALQLTTEARERSYKRGSENPQLHAQGFAKLLVDEARNKRTKDNTSVIVIDFLSNHKPSFHTR